MKNTPYENSRLAKFLDRRILELAGKKSQREIAIQAGFPNPNYVSMIKAGSSKLPLDRVPSMAKALDVDRNRAIGTACLTLASCSKTRV